MVPPDAGGEGANGAVSLETYFAMARGAQSGGLDVTALEMTKWFDTNYHYLVPELAPSTRFRLGSRKPLEEYLEARAAGIETVPVLVGPLSFLLLAKGFDDDGPATTTASTGCRCCPSCWRSTPRCDRACCATPARAGCSSTSRCSCRTARRTSWRP